MPIDKALSIMSKMAETGLDPACLDALKRALKRVDAAIAA
jgi:HD-GYP domain-containing protein (c-di-GMP phosphodiesterase class II)